MSAWLPWYVRTGVKVRHKQTGKVGEVIWCHPNGRDVEVLMDEGGDPVCWFGENVEPAQHAGKEGDR